MDEGNTSTGTDKIYVDLNEYPIDDIFINYLLN
jgi:hypothetical protein